MPVLNISVESKNISIASNVVIIFSYWQLSIEDKSVAVVVH